MKTKTNILYSVHAYGQLIIFGISDNWLKWVNLSLAIIFVLLIIFRRK